MKKILYTLLCAVVAVTMTSCDDVETYAEQRDAERAAISKYLVDQKIKVISEKDFLANDTTTDVSKNEYVLFESSGVYMQIVNRGCGEILKKGESADVLTRFKEYNVNGDSLQLTNMSLTTGYLCDKYNVKNTSGSFTASFNTSSSLMYLAYQSASVPAGWLVPLSYIRLGRPAEEGDEIAKVKLLVPHDQGHQYASQGVYACFYELSYQRGLN
mgnify:FL=1